MWNRKQREIDQLTQRVQELETADEASQVEEVRRQLEKDAGRRKAWLKDATVSVEERFRKHLAHDARLRAALAELASLHEYDAERLGVKDLLEAQEVS